MPFVGVKVQFLRTMMGLFVEQLILGGITPIGVSLLNLICSLASAEPGYPNIGPGDVYMQVSGDDNIGPWRCQCRPKEMLNAGPLRCQIHGRNISG